VEFLLVLIAVMGAFYFILLRPVMNQQRQHRRDISNLGVGDEVLTTGGFYATVKEINTFEDRPMELMLEAGPGVVLRGTTQAIQSVARRRLADEEPEPDELDDEDDEDWDDDDEWDDEALDDEEFDEDLDEDDDWEEDDDEWDEDEDDAATPRLRLTRRRSS
jgi:preprotein translocase YajC subunit